MNMGGVNIKRKTQRVYNKRSYKLKETVYWIIAILFAPIWTPFHVLAWLGYVLLAVGENITVFFNTVLESVLDRVVPQLKD